MEWCRGTRKTTFSGSAQRPRRRTAQRGPRLGQGPLGLLLAASGGATAACGASGVRDEPGGERGRHLRHHRPRLGVEREAHPQEAFQGGRQGGGQAGVAAIGHHMARNAGVGQPAPGRRAREHLEQKDAKRVAVRGLAVRGARRCGVCFVSVPWVAGARIGPRARSDLQRGRTESPGNRKRPGGAPTFDTWPHARTSRAECVTAPNPRPCADGRATVAALRQRPKLATRGFKEVRARGSVPGPGAAAPGASWAGLGPKGSLWSRMLRPQMSCWRRAWIAAMIMVWPPAVAGLPRAAPAWPSAQARRHKCMHRGRGPTCGSRGLQGGCKE
jgi:hypothetical protein